MFNYHPLTEKASAAGVIMVFLVLAMLAWLALRPPRTSEGFATNAPATLFSAGRAQADVDFLAQGPRPIASEANARARQYIVGHLRALGLHPEVQSAGAQETRTRFGQVQVSTGVANNIVLRKRGNTPDRARRPALLVATHYDSTPGAADAGAAVAAMLETLRALQYCPELANDVIFLFADGENAGALGARAFAEQHRWARDVGLVLQFDTAGNHAPLLLTATRGGNGRLLQGWIDAAPLALGSSALEQLARASDVVATIGPLDRVGPAGLRFATIEEGSGTIAVPSAAGQHAGETMLALTRHFGNVALAKIGSADQVHFELPLFGQVLYTSDFAWAVTRLACFMFLLACCMAVKHADMRLRMLGAGAMYFVLLAFALALAAFTLWQGLDGPPLASGAGARGRCHVLACVVLGLALFIELQRFLHKTIGSPATVLGALLVLLLALITSSWRMPALSYLLAWPLIGALLAHGLLQVPRVAAWPPHARLLVLLAGMAPAVLLIAPLLQQAGVLFAPQRSTLLMLALAGMLGFGTTLLAAARRRYVAPLLLACAGTLTLAGSAEAGAIAAQTQPNYLKDATSWKAWWVLPDEAQDSPGQPFFPNAISARGERRIARAPGSTIAFPHIAVLKDENDGKHRTIAFTLRSMNLAPTIALRVEGAATLRSRLDGKVITDRAASSWSLQLHGGGAAEHLVELELAPDRTARVYIQERIPGLPDGAGGPHPGAAPQAGMTLAADMLVFR